MFLRVPATEGQIPPGSFWFLLFLGVNITVGKNERPFLSSGPKMKELNRNKIINFILEILMVEFHELLGLKVSKQVLHRQKVCG